MNAMSISFLKKIVVLSTEYSNCEFTLTTVIAYNVNAVRTN